MKSTFLILAATTLLYSCSENTEKQEETTDSVTMEITNPYPHIPAEISSAFQADYPNVTGVEWEIGDSLYAAEFTDNGLEMAVMYRKDGARYGTKSAMGEALLPDPVKKTVATLGKPDNVYKLAMANGNTQYEVHIADKHYVYDEAGSMVQEKNKTIEQESE